MELKEEGWLTEEEGLMDVLREEKNLYRRRFGEEEFDSGLGDFPNDWTEEDFKYYEKTSHNSL